MAAAIAVDVPCFIGPPVAVHADFVSSPPLGNALGGRGAAGGLDIQTRRAADAIEAAYRHRRAFASEQLSETAR